MSTVVRWTGVPQLISFYRYIAFNVPRVTTAVGIAVLLGIAAIRLYWLVGGFPVSPYPAYLGGYFGLLVAMAILAAASMVVGSAPGLVRFGWVLGSVVSVASIAMYVTSRTVGLPGLPQLVRWWDYPIGSFAMVLAGLFVALHGSVITGMNVAYPQRRDWHD
ncbi:MAG: hypothetical protein JO100_02910 [Pseudonocardia sp.]|nr:hypothetical protein [Pseudonocardia sp.]